MVHLLIRVHYFWNDLWSLKIKYYQINFKRKYSIWNPCKHHFWYNSDNTSCKIITALPGVYWYLNGIYYLLWWVISDDIPNW